MASSGSARALAAAGHIGGVNRTVLASLRLSAIEPNPQQPRRHFDPTALVELAASIRARGLLQPIVVKRDGDRYLIMAGERRWRAAQLADLEAVPVLIRDDNPLEVAMIENLQREDLTPLEEAEGLGQLIDQFGYTHEALAEMLGKSRPYVSNTLALRRLPDAIKQEYYAAPDVSREILIDIARAESPERQALLWRLAHLRKLSVQKFRAEADGKNAATDSLRDVARLIRRLGRKLRTIEIDTLTAPDRTLLRRLLTRARQQVARILEAVETT